MIGSFDDLDLSGKDVLFILVIILTLGSLVF